MKSIPRLHSTFAWSAAVILSGAGILKVIAASGNAAYLALNEPVINLLTNREALLAIGICEILLAAAIYRYRTDNVGLVLVLWFVAVAVLYRIAVFLLKIDPHCPCFGNAGEWLGVSKTVTERAAIIVLIYLGLTACYLLWRRAKFLGPITRCSES